MGLKSCMNILCGTSLSTDWKTGWTLRSGDFAVLCHACGYAFERHIYCEEFHGDDSGWRECVTCSKRLHCGCIASLSLIELLDCGGVRCIGCARNLGPSLNTNAGKCDGSGPCIVTDNNVVLKQLPNYKENNRSIQLPTMQNPDSNVAFGSLKQEELFLPPSQAGSTWVSNLAQSSMGFFQKARLDISTISMQGKDNYGSMAHPNLNITLGVSSVNLQATSSTIINEREQRKISDTIHHRLVSPNLPPAPPKLAFPAAADANPNSIPQLRVVRPPPVEGRGRHQLLPRYWPRITDQELQQITGDSNCTIVPLFEKVLSASDAGRIGRLVLPKACAEAYFPPISQAEGLPIKIQDVKGKEWLFQFRFWPNNNSRMYVLEGVTPCIQSMQLQAGDTVTFSRMDPEGKLVMGFRKASNSATVQSMSTDTHTNALSRQPDSAGGNAQWQNSENYNERIEEGNLTTSMFMLEKKKGRNIGSKSKRLLINSQDALALRLTWEEVQGLLRPPQAARPSVVVVEDFEFEEYEEPPVFGKHSVFTARSSGAVEQWVQCDNCSKWRRLPGDILLPPKWACADNAWDQIRCFCSAPEELSAKELENIQQLNKDSTTKRRMVIANSVAQAQDCVNDLATTTTSGDNAADPGTSSIAATTKHPRHRPGCSCIVCIQPPSGKGKHKSTCTCTVCMTVKRRFKTLMMRKKKRQSEQEAEIALKNQRRQNSIIKEDDKSFLDNSQPHLEHQFEAEGEIQVGLGPTQTNDIQGLQNQIKLLAETGKRLDLNCHPKLEEDFRMKSSEASLTNLLQLASHPLEAYMKQNGLSSLSSQQAGSSSLSGQVVAGDIGEKAVEDRPAIQVTLKQGNSSNGCSNTENEQ